MLPAPLSPRFKVALIGAGQIAGGYDSARTGSLPEIGDDVFTHAGAYRTHGGFEMTAVIEPDTAKRTQFQQLWNIPHGFGTWAEFSATMHVDIISACAPTPLHAALLEQILLHPPRLVFAEKPLTGDALRSKSIVAAYRRQDVALAVNYLRRWQPGFRRFAAAFAAGEYGRMQAVSLFYTKGIKNNGSHFLDLIESLLGPLQPVTVTFANQGAMNDDADINAILISQSGVPVHLIALDAAYFKMLDLKFVTERGIVTFENAGFDIVEQMLTADPVFSDFKIPGARHIMASELSQAMPAAVENIYQYLVSGAPLRSTGDTALAVETTIDALLHFNNEPQRQEAV